MVEGKSSQLKILSFLEIDVMARIARVDWDFKAEQSFLFCLKDSSQTYFLGRIVFFE